MLADKLCHWHFAPTQWSADNLLREGVPAETIFVTGNTIVDALQSISLDEEFTDPRLTRVDDRFIGRSDPDPGPGRWATVLPGTTGRGRSQRSTVRSGQSRSGLVADDGSSDRQARIIAIGCAR